MISVVLTQLALSSSSSNITFKTDNTSRTGRNSVAACTPKSNTRQRMPGPHCTEHVVSSV
eukprot:3438031-Rhodomonas_salina.3